MAEYVKWASKYRPKVLEDYVGNTSLKGRISKLITEDKLPTNILLEGSSGTGKTTMARLMAKSLLCESRVDGMACGECGICKALDDRFILKGEQPRGVNVFEFDIGKSNSVDDANEVVEMMGRGVVGNPVRVFILDEIQRATKSAQSVYLKIAEEPPQNLYIIICTTNPEDLLDPFKSRFITMSVKKPSMDEIVDRLKVICESEGVRYSEDALRLLVDASKKTPRDSISKLEYISSVGDVTIQNVEEEIGAVSHEVFGVYLKAVVRGDLLTCNRLIGTAEEKGITPFDFITNLGSYLQDMVYLRSRVNLEKYTETAVAKIKDVLKEIDDELLTNMLIKVGQYSFKRLDDSYILNALTLELIKLTREEDKYTQLVEDIMSRLELDTKEESTKGKFRELTEKMSQTKNTEEDRSMELNDAMLGKVFNSSKVKRVRR